MNLSDVAGGGAFGDTAAHAAAAGQPGRIYLEFIG